MLALAQHLLIYAALPVSVWAIFITVRDAMPRVREIF